MKRLFVSGGMVKRDAPYISYVEKERDEKTIVNVFESELGAAAEGVVGGCV